MMLLGFVGFTAMDVSLCGTLSSQDVLTFVALDVAVEQIGTPLRTPPGGLPKTAAVTGAAAPTALWLKSIGWGRAASGVGVEVDRLCQVALGGSGRRSDGYERRGEKGGRNNCQRPHSSADG